MSEKPKFRAKKSLGQHFLTSKKVVEKIASAGSLEKTDTVLEIGPGKGVLTHELLSRAGRVIAIEKDSDLLLFLKLEFMAELEAGTLELIHDDVLKTTTEHFGDYKLVANIPYYITGAIIKQFLTCTNPPKKIVLLIQKEVAQRITAKDGKESVLSLSVKAYGKPSIIAKVGKQYFSPPPKVDSAILLIDTISKDFFDMFDEKTFFYIIKQAFSQKRKKVLNNFPKEEAYILQSAFLQLGIDSGIRAEDIALSQWKEIISFFHKK